MSDPFPTDAATPAPAVAVDDWQPLPPRARGLFVAGTAFGFALPLTIAPAVLGVALLPWPLAGLAPLSGLAIGAAFGAWLGNKRYRYTSWRLDANGFALRRGRMWRSETRVPGSRVQHLDIRRGPLQRRYRLATLVIHTAGTRHSAVALSGLDEQDAEMLRDQLARRADADREDD